MSAERLRTIVTAMRKELAVAQKKARFWQAQHAKDRHNQPDLATSTKVLSDNAASEVKLLAKQIGALTRLQKRYAELEAKKEKVGAKTSR